MALEGRPPVTNLYSSAIFIGWGTMVLGLILEKIYRVGIGSVLASLAGFITLMIAHNLALGGDTMEMLRAVLDTNFWLATHVVVITLGYASTFGAGLLAILYIFLGVFTPLLSHKLAPGVGSSARVRQREIEGARRAGLPIANRQSQIGNLPGPDPRHHGLWHRLLRHPVQLRRHRPGRHLGRPILGPVLGLGPEGERRPAHRASGTPSSSTCAGAT